MKFNESIYQSFALRFQTIEFEESEYLAHHGVARYKKKKGNAIYRISLSMSLTNRGFVRISGDLGFESMNYHLGKIIDLKNPDFEPLLTSHEVWRDKEAWTQILKDLGSMPLKLKSEVEAFQVAIMNHVGTYILPFFEKYPDLQAVNDKILNVIPQNDYSDYIPGLEKNLKVLIIMRLCGNPKYEEFRDWALDAYKRGVEIDANKYAQGLKDIQKLVAYLESEDFKKD